MEVTFQLEADLEEQLRRELGDLSRVAREAFLIEAYRQGKLSIGRLARTLHLGVLEAEAWLAARSVPLNYSVQDLEADVATLRRLHEQGSE